MRTERACSHEPDHLADSGRQSAGDTSVCYLAIRMQPSDTVEVRVRDASGREVSARRILATDGGH